jgi:hypothetical protein
VSGLHGFGLKWSRIGQPHFRYLASMLWEGWFAVVVVSLGVLTVAMTAVAVFWH